MIHNPIDFPVQLNGNFIHPNTYNEITIMPRMVTASEELERWHPSFRGCYYNHEKVLKFFKLYSLYNCELECRANKTKDMCGCVPHYYPSKSVKFYYNILVFCLLP